MNTRIGVGILVYLGLAVPAAVASTAEESAALDQLRTCAMLANANQRLRCYDGRTHSRTFAVPKPRKCPRPLSYQIQLPPRCLGMIRPLPMTPSVLEPKAPPKSRAGKRY